MLDNGLLDAALEELGDEELMDDYANPWAYRCAEYGNVLSSTPTLQ